MSLTLPVLSEFVVDVTDTTGTVRICCWCHRYYRYCQSSLMMSPILPVLSEFVVDVTDTTGTVRVRC